MPAMSAAASAGCAEMTRATAPATAVDRTEFELPAAAVAVVVTVLRAARRGAVTRVMTTGVAVRDIIFTRSAEGGRVRWVR